MHTEYPCNNINWPKLSSASLRNKLLKFNNLGLIFILFLFFSVSSILAQQDSRIEIQLKSQGKSLAKADTSQKDIDPADSKKFKLDFNIELQVEDLLDDVRSFLNDEGLAKITIHFNNPIEGLILNERLINGTNSEILVELENPEEWKLKKKIGSVVRQYHALTAMDYLTFKVNAISDNLVSLDQPQAEELDIPESIVIPTYDKEEEIGNSSHVHLKEADPTKIDDIVKIKADYKVNYIFVEWEIKRDENISHFVIERMKEGEEDYLEIGEIFALASSNDSDTYSYNDYDKYDEGKYTYRIKIVQIDGQTHFTDATEVEVELDIFGQETLTMYPNPCEDQFNIEISLVKPVNILSASIFNKVGDIVYSDIIKESSLIAGNYMYKIQNMDVEPGKYSVLITMDNQQVVEMLNVIQN